nr:MAG: DNA binding protein-like protein [Bacteriophage sp.]
MSLIDKIKADVKKGGQNKRKFTYFKEGQKQRIRFLQDMDEGMEIPFHDSYELGINVPCQKLFDRECPCCDDESLRTRNQYVWSVYNYEAKEVQLFMYAVNNCTPIPALMAMYENYGTLTDRDYVISVTGKAQNKTYSVVPMDKVKFRNAKAKPYSNKAVLQMIDKAYPCEGTEDEEEEDEAPRKKKKATKKSVKKVVEEPEGENDYDSEEEWDEAEESENDYSSMTPLKLYKLCKEREIEAEKKKPAKYYINLLEEYDNAQEDWGDAEDDEDADEWEEEDDE